MVEYTNSKMMAVIGEYIHSERDRKVLARIYIDGIGQERAAEEVNLTPRQIQNILYKHKNTIIMHL